MGLHKKIGIRSTNLFRLSFSPSCIAFTSKSNEKTYVFWFLDNKLYWSDSDPVYKDIVEMLPDLNYEDFKKLKLDLVELLKKDDDEAKGEWFAIIDGIVNRDSDVFKMMEIVYEKDFKDALSTHKFFVNHAIGRYFNKTISNSEIKKEFSKKINSTTGLILVDEVE